jgi:hypothetical protein
MADWWHCVPIRHRQSTPRHACAAGWCAVKHCSQTPNSYLPHVCARSPPKASHHEQQRINQQHASAEQYWVIVLVIPSVSLSSPG